MTERGFSLIELLIVVAIILIIAAIAIPNFLRSRIAANQASAIESLRVISTAEVTYSTTYGTGFSTSLAVFGSAGCRPGNQLRPQQAWWMKSLPRGYKSGYSFFYTPSLYNAATNTWNGYTLLGESFDLRPDGRHVLLHGPEFRDSCQLHHPCLLDGYLGGRLGPAPSLLFFSMTGISPPDRFCPCITCTRGWRPGDIPCPAPAFASCTRLPVSSRTISCRGNDRSRSPC